MLQQQKKAGGQQIHPGCVPALHIFWSSMFETLSDVFNTCNSAIFGDREQ